MKGDKVRKLDTLVSLCFSIATIFAYLTTLVRRHESESESQASLVDFSQLMNATVRHAYRRIANCVRNKAPTAKLSLEITRELDIVIERYQFRHWVMQSMLSTLAIQDADSLSEERLSPSCTEAGFCIMRKCCCKDILICVKQLRA